MSTAVASTDDKAVTIVLYIICQTLGMMMIDVWPWMKVMVATYILYATSVHTLRGMDAYCMKEADVDANLPSPTADNAFFVEAGVGWQTQQTCSSGSSPGAASDLTAASSRRPCHLWMYRA